ncbi:class II glutamine amidotransferase [Glaciihabitans sp. INWT7]|uniref:class II glutamine amidotransferase n=1 Tax=Glaciihabitans sp. INWT7 TaxID=2596912 RepID=UPI0016246BA9|nr:class II glutamine amidotransferase [Glaciihabitans sp. INWT7]QNE46520.1 class II glutamine amidotransferase [Glaciihabitans sp. INWT7]
MCRLIGFASPEPTTLADLIGELQCSTFQHMSRLHADGWGTMWIDAENRIESLKIATPGQDDDALTASMTDEQSRTRVLHLRMATDGMAVRLENSHPFVTDGIGLAHNGSIVPTELLREHLTPQILAGVRGETDSELYLAAVRQAVATGLSLADAVFETVRWLREAYPKASLNALIMSDSEFVAVHASSFATPPLAEFEASGLTADQLPLDHVDSYYTLSYLRRENGAVAFSSTGIDRAGWTPLPAESVTSVDLRSFDLVTRTLAPAAERVR